MNDRDPAAGPFESVDVGDYCRRVESHLTRVNAGHLVRIVGPAFDLVRRWAEDGVPLNVVLRGIDRKAERHNVGRAKRPLRIEFCEADVRDVFENWRRAVGIPGTVMPGQPIEPEGAQSRRRPSLSKHVERVLDRLGRLTGRLDWPEELRDGVEGIRTEVLSLQESAKGARGAAKDPIIERLVELDRDLLALARRSAPASVQRQVRQDAEADLAGYRGRLAPDVYRQSVDVTADRLLRDRFGLPTLDPSA